MIPLHLVAFGMIYVFVVRYLEQQVLSTTFSATRMHLEHEADELAAIALAISQPGEVSPRHVFQELADAHGDFGFELYLPGGSTITPSDAPTPLDYEEMAAFLVEGETRKIWLDTRDGRRQVRGLMRLVATTECAACHQLGETLAVTSLKLDISELLATARGRARLSLAGLFAVWALALTLITLAIQRSVRRSLGRLEGELTAAASGRESAIDRGPGLLLDATSAELHDRLRQYLRRQRERQEEMASRLAHTDLLASLGKLASGLAGEITDPIAGVRGALQILKEDASNASVERLCDQMIADLERVSETLRSLQASSRSTPPRLTTTDLCELLEEVRQLMEPALRHVGVGLSKDTGVNRLEVEIDPAQIRQVLIDLVENAAEAVEGDPGAAVTLRAGRLPDGQGVVVTVEDNGPGIPAEQQPRVFEPFYSTKFSGTGLGLTVARSLVELHGGSLEFESAAGHGTTFYVILPGASEAAAETHQQTSEPSTPGAGEPRDSEAE